MCQQLQKDNHDLATIIKIKDDGSKTTGKESSEAKKDIKFELSKVKKTVRDKDKEISKLRGEITNLKRVEAPKDDSNNTTNNASKDIKNPT